ncbi:MAG: glycerophosphodiester phosphodiesterase family protein, partial [Pseudomonadota bacterium]
MAVAVSLLSASLLAAGPAVLQMSVEPIAAARGGVQRVDAPPLGFSSLLACARRQGAAIPVAHRGRADASQPENSASGIVAALRAETRVIELDLRRTRDEVLFLHHDDTLARTTGLAGAAGSASWRVLSATYLTHDDGQTAGERPLKLADAFSIASHDAYLLLDLKDDSATVSAVAATVNAGWQDRTAFIVYSVPQARAVRHALPGALIALGAN